MSAPPPEPPALVKVKFDSLDPVIQNLLKEATAAGKLAYCPYSKFQVGASVLCEDQSTYKGCNVENAAHGSICAERTAYVKAISEGKRKFKAVAVVAYQEHFTTTPCGVCRQFMSEFGNVDVYMSKPALENVYVSSIKELLPFQFQLNEDGTF